MSLTGGTQDAFVVKGNLQPRTLVPGDYVRIWVAYRQGRPYLQRGELRQSAEGTWTPLNVSEPSSGGYWVAALVFLSIILVYIYLTYLRG